jgi:hypothetical protein
MDAWQERRASRITVFELGAELATRRYRWWALLALALFVGLGTTLPGGWVLLPGFVLGVVVCSLAVSQIRTRRREAEAVEAQEGLSD